MARPRSRSSEVEEAIDAAGENDPEVKVRPDVSGCWSTRARSRHHLVRAWVDAALRPRLLRPTFPVNGIHIAFVASACDHAISNRIIVRNAAALSAFPFLGVPGHERYSLEIMTAIVDDGHRSPALNRGSKPEFGT